MTMESLSIIIVNWNAGHQLRDCINSIQKFGAPYVIQTIVVDNASTDGSESTVTDVLDITVILSGENLGFGKACNLGAQHAQGEYLLFLNPDAALYKDTLSITMAFMERPENSGVGICGIRLVDENGDATTSAARFPSLRILAGKTLGLSKLIPSLFPAHLMTPEELNESQTVDQVIGAFFLIRKNLFDRCQGFDERFFVYFEEVDLSLRAMQLGYTSYFLSDATAFHKGGGCSARVKATRLFYSLRSRVLYAQKHYSAISYFLLIVLTAVELPLRLVQSVVRRSWADVQDTLSAYRQLIGYFLWRI